MCRALRPQRFPLSATRRGARTQRPVRAEDCVSSPLREHHHCASSVRDGFRQPRPGWRSVPSQRCQVDAVGNAEDQQDRPARSGCAETSAGARGGEVPEDRRAGADAHGGAAPATPRGARVGRAGEPMEPQLAGGRQLSSVGLTRPGGPPLGAPTKGAEERVGHPAVGPAEIPSCRRPARRWTPSASAAPHRSARPGGCRAARGETPC